jgi:hypothetical protein
MINVEVKLQLYIPWRHIKWSGVIVPVSLNTGTWCRQVVSLMPQKLYLHKIDPGTHWTWAWVRTFLEEEKPLTPARILTPYHPACSQCNHSPRITMWLGRIRSHWFLTRHLFILLPANILWWTIKLPHYVLCDCPVPAELKFHPNQDTV